MINLIIINFKNNLQFENLINVSILLQLFFNSYLLLKIIYVCM